MIDTGFLELCRNEETDLLLTLERLVHLPSPSTEKSYVDRLVDLVAARLAESAIEPRLEKRTAVGNPVWGEWAPAQPEGRILVLCHLDTVWPADAEQRNPFRAVDGKVYGPGILDMKASVAFTFKVQEFLARQVIRPRKAVRFLYTTDEETGSLESRKLIEDFARESNLALVLEPALPGGGLKTSRKGSGIYEIEVIGRPAHAGLEPEKGINSIEEMALQIAEIKQLANPGKGTTITFTLIQGGTACNVVPDRCKASIDVRFRKPDEGHRVDSALKSRQAFIPGADVRVTGDIDRPPMLRGPRMDEIFQAARKIAAELGIELWEGETGGGSDGNFTAALGIPTLDGLGAEGAGAHTWDEHIFQDSLVPRLALLARLIERL
ncbi:MAG TPA: M20 family metallopeptidase [Acidobacteriota bacterium]|nr:M20 family metallopeptidase [Acidobacteriota bacterium]